MIHKPYFSALASIKLDGINVEEDGKLDEMAGSTLHSMLKAYSRSSFLSLWRKGY